MNNPHWLHQEKTKHWKTRQLDSWLCLLLNTGAEWNRKPDRPGWNCLNASLSKVLAVRLVVLEVDIWRESMCIQEPPVSF
jgi:hypothetical protein